MHCYQLCLSEHQRRGGTACFPGFTCFTRFSGFPVQTEVQQLLDGGGFGELQAGGGGGVGGWKAR